MSKKMKIHTKHLPYTRHYNPRIFFEEFPCLLHKLSLILNALDYSEKWGENIQAAAYNGARVQYME